MIQKHFAGMRSMWFGRENDKKRIKREYIQNVVSEGVLSGGRTGRTV